MVINRYFQEPGVAPVDDRHVLLRVITSEDDTTRERIIRATNSQTPIRVASIRAIDDLHRAIEVHLLPFGYSYERRHNFYKNKGVQKDQIITVDALTQALASGLLHRPADARARVSNLLRDDATYEKMYAPDHDIHVYSQAVQLSKRVERYLRDRGCAASERNNLRQHVATALSVLTLKSLAIDPVRFAQANFAEVSDAQVATATGLVRLVFDDLMQEKDLPQDRVAKSPESTGLLMEMLAQALE